MKTSWPIPFKILAVNFDSGFPGKPIACAFKCDENPKCAAYSFDETNGCNLMSIKDGTTVPNQPVFRNVKGNIQLVYFSFLPTVM